MQQRVQRLLLLFLLLLLRAVGGLKFFLVLILVLQRPVCKGQQLTLNLTRQDSCGSFLSFFHFFHASLVLQRFHISCQQHQEKQDMETLFIFHQFTCQSVALKRFFFPQKTCVPSVFCVLGLLSRSSIQFLHLDKRSAFVIYQILF